MRFNHPPASVWAMTPRQIAAHLEFADADARLEAAQALVISTLGARGSQRDVDKTLGEWTRD